MAHLLGDPVCIDSLRKDINDLQVAIIDISSRVGPTSYKSWKYPDKKSCDLDVADLLETYNYCENDEEDTQVAHIVLYELVIDRLLLYIQSINKYLDGLMPTDRAMSAATNTSIGIVTRKFWNRMVKLHSTVQQLQSDTLLKTKRLSDAEENLKKVQNNMDTNPFPQSASVTAVTPQPMPKTPVHDISHDCCHRAAQTYKTAFLPCESCAVVQQNLRNVGESVINLCRQQGIPSALNRFKPHVVNLDWMTANEVGEWVGEQNKDLTRITKQVENLAETVRAQRDAMSTETEKCKKLQAQVNNHNKELKVEKDNQAAFRRQVDIDTELKAKDSKELVAREVREKSKVWSLKAELESQLKRVSSELEKQTSTLKLVEKTKSELEHELEETRIEAARSNELESHVTELRTQLSHVTDELQTANGDLTHEQARNRSAGKYQQSVQSKQELLVRRVEEMDRECEELRGEMNEVEVEKEEMERELGETREELVRLQEQGRADHEMIEELNKEKTTLQLSITEMEGLMEELKVKFSKAAEKERLLVEYPDLNGPVRIDTGGSGDIAIDMENQITANDMRIDILEKQNVVLRNTVEKMIQSRQDSRIQVQIGKPVPLWNMTAPVTPQIGASVHSLAQHKDKWSHYEATVPSSDKAHHSQPPLSQAPSTSPNADTHSCTSIQDQARNLSGMVVGKIIRTESASNKRRTSSSAKKIISNKSPPLVKGGGGDKGGLRVTGDDMTVRAYINIKKMLGTATGDTTGVVAQPHRLSKPPQPTTKSLACPKCDKLYTCNKDLEIHALYCYGKPRVFDMDSERY